MGQGVRVWIRSWGRFWGVDLIMGQGVGCGLDHGAGCRGMA